MILNISKGLTLLTAKSSPTPSPRLPVSQFPPSALKSQILKSEICEAWTCRSASIRPLPSIGRHCLTWKWFLLLFERDDDHSPVIPRSMSPQRQLTQQASFSSPIQQERP